MVCATLVQLAPRCDYSQSDRHVITVGPRPTAHVMVCRFGTMYTQYGISCQLRARYGALRRADPFATYTVFFYGFTHYITYDLSMSIVEKSKCRYCNSCICICMCMKIEISQWRICRERSRFADAVCLVLETAVGAMPLGSRWDVANLAECVTDTKKSAGSKGGTTRGSRLRAVTRARQRSGRCEGQCATERIRRAGGGAESTGT